MIENKSISNFRYLFSEGFNPSWIPVSWVTDLSQVRHARAKCKTSNAIFAADAQKTNGDLGDIYQHCSDFCSSCFPSLMVGSMKVETWDRRISEFRRQQEEFSAPLATLDQAIKLHQGMLTRSSGFQFNVSGPYSSEVSAFFDDKLKELNQKIRHRLAEALFSTDMHKDLAYRLIYENISSAQPFAYDLFPREGQEHKDWIKRTARSMAKDPRWAVFASYGHISVSYERTHSSGAELAREIFRLNDSLVLAPIGLVPSFSGSRLNPMPSKDMKILNGIPKGATVEAFNVLYQPYSTVYSSISAAWEAAEALE